MLLTEVVVGPFSIGHGAIDLPGDKSGELRLRRVRPEILVFTLAQPYIHVHPCVEGEIVRLASFEQCRWGLESGVVRVVVYDPAWAELFIQEADRLRRALGNARSLALKHMGSTAVPGLAANPVLDLLSRISTRS